MLLMSGRSKGRRAFYSGWLRMYSLNLKLCEYILYFLDISVTSYLNGDSISYHIVFLSYCIYPSV